MYVGHLYGFFGRMSVHVFCPFLNWIIHFWVLSFISSLYILDTNLLSDISFRNIFCHSIGCISVLFIVSCVVNFSHSDKYEVVSHRSFDLYFPDDE